jgi:hypothetical protein
LFDGSPIIAATFAAAQALISRMLLQKVQWQKCSRNMQKVIFF